MLSYRNILELYSHKVITYGNGFDAITKYIEFSPEIILMECELPKISGWKTAWQIKEFDESAQIILMADKFK